MNHKSKIRDALLVGIATVIGLKLVLDYFFLGLLLIAGIENNTVIAKNPTE